MSVKSIVNSLRNKRDVVVDEFNGVIRILSNKVENGKGEMIPNIKKSNDLGIGSWRRIDKLVKKYNFQIRYTESFK